MVTHKNMDALEAGLPEIRQSPKDNGTLEMIVIRPSSGERVVAEHGSLTRALVARMRQNGVSHVIIHFKVIVFLHLEQRAARILQALIERKSRRPFFHAVQQAAQPGGAFPLGQFENQQGAHVLGAVVRFRQQEAAVDG